MLQKTLSQFINFFINNLGYIPCIKIRQDIENSKIEIYLSHSSFYNPKFAIDNFIDDLDIKKSIKEFNDSSNFKLEIHHVSEVNSPLLFKYSDFEIIDKDLYVTSRIF